MAAAVLLPGIAAAADQPNVPSVAAVTDRLNNLAATSKTLTAQYTAAQAQVRVAQLQAAVAARRADAAAAALQQARSGLVSALAAQYEDSTFSRVAALLTSDSDENYLQTLSTLDLLSAHWVGIVSGYKAAKAQADAAQAHAAALAADAQARRNALGKQRNQILAETRAFRSLLTTLTLAQQMAYQAGSSASAAAVQWAAQCAEQYMTSPVSAGGCAGSGHYVNPFAGESWTADRTDQGVDWDANQPEPVRAIGDGVVTYSTTQQAGWPGGAFLVYGLITGSHAGQFIYVAENLTDLVPAGTVVKAGQQIAVAIPGGPGTEWGFAAPPGTGPNVATPYAGAPDGTQTAGGKAFARFLIELGVRPAQPPGPGPDSPY